MILFAICLACFCSPTFGLNSTKLSTPQPTSIVDSISSSVIKPSTSEIIQISTTVPAILQTTQNVEPSSISLGVVSGGSSGQASETLSSTIPLQTTQNVGGLSSTTSTIQPSKTENLLSTSSVSTQQQNNGSKMVDFPKVDTQRVDKVTQYEGYDGWYNNRGKHDLGAVDMWLTRRIPSEYEDGVYQPSGFDRPNPFTLSDKLMSGNISSSCASNKSVLLVFFGQQVVDEIVDSRRPSCPPEYFNIYIPHDHKLYKSAGDPKRMPFVRTRYDKTTGKSPGNPRQQVNEVTPWIDGGLMYGTSKVWANELRSFKDGQLAKSTEGNWPEENKVGLPMENPPPPTEHELMKSDRLFKLGNRRGNENPFLLSLGIMWFRYHNLLAKRIKAQTNITDDDKLFNEARKWVIATHQKIVFYDWLPAFLGVDPEMFKKKTEYAYNPLANPSITQIFQSAAMRIGHTMVPPGVMRRLENDCSAFKTTASSSHLGKAGANKMGIRLCNSYWNSKVPSSCLSVRSTYQLAKICDNIATRYITDVISATLVLLNELNHHTKIHDPTSRHSGLVSSSGVI